MLSLPFLRSVSSGRAALWHAIRLAREARDALSGSATAGVLVPTYHPRTLIAPVIAQGLRADFYPLTASGLPDVGALDAYARLDTCALVLPHFFGAGRSFASVRKWCTTRGIALIEDCAHALQGHAGERPVGHWGDYATASLSKFSPAPEAGLLGSAEHRLPRLALQGAPWRDEAKVLKNAVDYWLLAREAEDSLSGLLQRTEAGVVPLPPLEPDPVSTLAEALQDGRLGQVHQHAAWSARLLAREAGSAAAAARRRQHFATYAAALTPLAALRCPVPVSADGAPYVYPVWFPTDAMGDTAYRALRGAGAAVFRWDQRWPQTPNIEGDAGHAWSHQLLQLACHPTLRADQVERTAAAVAALARHCL